MLVTLCFWLETSTSRKPVNCECLQAMQDKAFSLANPIVTVSVPTFCIIFILFLLNSLIIHSHLGCYLQQWHKENELPLCTGNGTAKDDCIFQYASNDEVLGKFENISRILHDLQTVGSLVITILLTDNRFYVLNKN